MLIQSLQYYSQTVLTTIGNMAYIPVQKSYFHYFYFNYFYLYITFIVNFIILLFFLLLVLLLFYIMYLYYYDIFTFILIFDTCRRLSHSTCIHNAITQLIKRINKK